MRPYNIISPFPLTVLALAGGLAYLGVKVIPDIQQKSRENDWRLFVQGKEEHWKKMSAAYNAQVEALIAEQKRTGEKTQSPLSHLDVTAKEKILRQFDTYISERFNNYAMRDKFIPYDVRKAEELEKLVSK